MQSQQHSQTHPPIKATPGRRRANRQPAHKTYASENDMATDIFPPAFVSQLPLTPQRQARGSPGPASQLTANSRSKPRTANKTRQKHASSTSPGETRQGRTTPPQQSQQSQQSQSAAPKSAAVAAFAGATFHASPAPSSLPIPSFLAKAALDSPVVKDISRENQEPSPPATDTEPPTPQHRITATEIIREESPLDIFFRADRAEKERARRASSANIFSTVPRPFSPPRQTQSPQEARTLPNGAGSLRIRRPGGPQRTTSSGISAVELDGTPGKPMGPAFSTPYQERIRAARSNEQYTPQLAQQKTPSPPQQQDSTTEELSDKLKRFLAIPTGPKDGNIQQTRTVTTTTTTTTTSSSSTTFQANNQQNYSSYRGVQSLPAQQPSDRAVPAGAPNYRSPNVLDMENSLRRMLKIDAGISLGGAPASPASYQSS